MTKPENSLSAVFTENCAWQSNVPESAVNHANMQIPPNGSAKKWKLCFPEVKLLTWNANCSQWQTKSRCFFLLINPTKCNSTTIESGKLIWVSFRHRIVDLIQWSVVLSTLTLKSPFKTCGKYLIRTCNAKDFTNRLSLTSFQTHGTCSTIRKLLRVVVS